MKKSYEIPVVFRVMPDEETRQAVDQVIAWLENSTEGVEDAGTVTRIDRTRLGRRRLAYEIKGQRDGFYVLIYADVEPLHLPEFELNVRLYDPVLRYLIIRDDESKATGEEAVEETPSTGESAPEAVETPEADVETEESDSDEVEEESASEESDD